MGISCLQFDCTGKLFTIFHLFKQSTVANPGQGQIAGASCGAMPSDERYPAAMLGMRVTGNQTIEINLFNQRSNMPSLHDTEDMERHGTE